MIHIEILSPQETVFSGSIKAAVFPSPDGQFEVLERHAPLISQLQKGNIALTLPSSERKNIAIKGGFVKVSDNNIIAIVE